MSRTLLIAPHADDETLFAAYLAQRYGAVIAVVYDEGRVSELTQAGNWLGCSTVQLSAQKGMDGEQVEAYLNGFDPQEWARVIAPAYEVEGHEEHNLIAEIVTGWARDELEIIRYTTYAPRAQRTRGREEVFPDQPDYVARKLAALSCYRSQIADPATAPWFYSLLDMREWIA